MFDLCESILWNPASAQTAFQSIIKELGSKLSFETYSTHERAWVLRITCEKLKSISQHNGRRLTSSEQIELDSNLNLASRLKKFEFYFHRLGTEDRLLLLLKDKYLLPLPEIATALNAPEASLKTQRQQALRALEDWLWNYP